MATLMRHDLIDEYRIWIHPLVLGTGKRLFEHGFSARALRLADSRPLGTGVIILTYRPQ
jgi:dihydrofolate reductase